MERLTRGWRLATESLGVVRSDPALFRGAAELHDLVGDASKARRVLGWEPDVTFEELVALLVEADLAKLQTPAASS